MVRLQSQDPPAATLALVAAVALQEVGEAYAATTEMQLKWPNDLLAGGGKIAGILLERSADTVIIGFGVNLEHYPADTLYPAASFRALTGATPDPDDFLSHLTTTFAAWLSRWRNEGVAPVRTRWLDKAHAIGTALSVTGPNGDRVEGLFDGLTTEGALRLRLADGLVHVIHAGDVFLI